MNTFFNLISVKRIYFNIYILNRYLWIIYINKKKPPNPQKLYNNLLSKNSYFTLQMRYSKFGFTGAMYILYNIVIFSAEFNINITIDIIHYQYIYQILLPCILPLSITQSRGLQTPTGKSGNVQGCCFIVSPKDIIRILLLPEVI